MSESTYSQRYAALDSNTAGTFAFDTISAKDYAVSKLAFGAVGSVTYVDASNPLPVTFSGNVTVVGTGTFLVQAAQSGTWNIGTVTGITNVVHVDDNSGSLTVDAPVGTPVFVRLSDGSAAIPTLPVSLASVPSHAVTNAGVFVVQENGSALTSLQLIDDVVHSGDATLSKYAVIGAVLDDVGTGTVTENNANSLRMSSRRALLVEGVASGTNINVNLAASAATVTVSGTVAATQSGTWLKLVPASRRNTPATVYVPLPRSAVGTGSTAPLDAE